MTGTPPGHGLLAVADAGAFLARLARLDPAAVVRLRTAEGANRTTLWGRLPWGVLVSRTVDGPGAGDATVSAADLLAELDRGGRSLPARRDMDWRWPLPPPRGRVVETLPAVDVWRAAAAAAETLRVASVSGVHGRSVGSRMLRDALLDHVAIVVTGSGRGDFMLDGGGAPAGARGAVDGPRIEVPQRLVQAVTRMGFLGPHPSMESLENAGRPLIVHIRLNGRWVALSAPYGIAWLQIVNKLGVKPGVTSTNG